MPSLVDLLARAAAGGGGIEMEGARLSHRELYARALGFAALLRSHGAGPGDYVAVISEKSLETTVAICGILCAGAAYVPIDPHQSEQRITDVLADGGITLLTARPERIARLGGVAELAGCRLVAASIAGPAGEAAEEPAVPGPDSVAYVLYSSGSTGRPKGIVHTHASAMAFVAWGQETFDVTEADRLAGHASFHFDLSIFDLFVSLSAATDLVLVPEGTGMMPQALAPWIVEERITVWYSVPYILARLAIEAPEALAGATTLREVLFAGERMAPHALQLLAACLPQARFTNLYGPTETNVCTWHRVAALPDGRETIPIGVACAGAELLVAGPTGAPAGEGELLVAAPTNMLEYWGNPEATARAFVIDGGKRFYRTGDLVAWRGGVLHFLGRADRQIKIKGYRIELADVEMALAGHPAVASCAAFVVGAEGENRTLHVAVVPAPGHDQMPAPKELRRFLRDLLPAYAVPAAIHQVGALPLTGTGKVDSRRLAETVEKQDAL